MIQLDIQQLQEALPKYLEQLGDSDTIIVCKDNVPIAEIRPLPPPCKEPRPLGLAKGMVEIPPSFFEPLPPDILAAFEGREE